MLGRSNNGREVPLNLQAQLTEGRNPTPLQSFFCGCPADPVARHFCLWYNM